MPKKITSLKGWARHLWGDLQVLNKKPIRVELPLWRLSCNFTRTEGGLDLAMKDKDTPHAVGVSSSPVRASTAT